MDYKKLAAETITAVRYHTDKEDEEYGGVVLVERLDSALIEAGVDMQSKPNLEGMWFGVSDEVLMELVTAFIEDPSFKENVGEDPGVARVQSDCYDALQENPHLEQSHPEFWQRAMAVL